MSTITRAVVVGLDRSDQGRAAVEYAAARAMRRHLPLRLVHAFEPSQYAVRSTVGWTPDLHGVLRNSAQRLVDETTEVLAMVYPDLELQTRLEPGSAVEILVEESEHADTVVVGSRGSGGFADLIIGSTTLHVASQARCPVVAVPSPPDGEAPRHGVVVGVDGSALSESAIGFALQVASELDEPLVALHAWTDPARLGPGLMLPLVYDPALVADEEGLVLAESMAGWAEKYPDVRIENKVTRGHAVQALTAEARNARLLVVGSRGRGSVRSMIGSVSHGVLHHATGPVAVVHQRD
jgi:nucleotide-binding universal stress UspA family protein